MIKSFPFFAISPSIGGNFCPPKDKGQQLVVSNSKWLGNVFLAVSLRSKTRTRQDCWGSCAVVVLWNIVTQICQRPEN